MRRDLLSLFFVLLSSAALYAGSSRAFAFTSWPDISSGLLSTAALVGGILFFGLAADSLAPDRAGWALVPTTGRRVPVRGLLIVGQGALADLRGGALVERHARLFLRGPELFLEDTAKRGDVLVNGVALSAGPTALKAGDVVALPGLSFRVEQG